MVTVLLILGGVFGAALLAYGFMQPSRLGLILSILTPVLLLAALILENLDEALFDREEVILVVLLVILAVGGLAIWLFGRRRAVGSRVVGMALTLLVLAIVVPAFSASLDLPEQLNQLPTPTPGPTQTINERARGIFDRVVLLVADETGLPEDEVVLRLDEGEAVADMVRETESDMEAVIAGISELLTEQIQLLAAEGDLNEVQASFALSQMDVIVRVGVEQDLAESLARFERDPVEEIQATPGGE